MKNLLVGNGINIQFEPNDYTTQQIVLRILKNCDREDFPTHIIVNFPYLLKNYLGQLFLEARNVINGNYDQYAYGSPEKSSLLSFKERYSPKIQTLRMTDIGFEDYYLLHDLACHKTKTTNPEQFYVRESLRIAYLYSIYNDGKVNSLFKLYPDKFIRYLKSFDSIFTTNYDSNVDSATNKIIYHIHGSFDKLSAVYDSTSFRNKLPDAPINEIAVDLNYAYLYSNALSAHCGEYKHFQLKQTSQANSAVEKLTTAYLNDPAAQSEIDSWAKDKNTITANLGTAIQLKAKHPELTFSDDYHLSRLAEITGELDILGLSPWNDFHIFETIDKSNLNLCNFYYRSTDQCEKITSLLPNISQKGILKFIPVKIFWERET